VRVDDTTLKYLFLNVSCHCLPCCHAKDQDWEEKDLIKKRAEEAAKAAEQK